jgi:glycosyltransferase involved in cell wall biosynthesis
MNVCFVCHGYPPAEKVGGIEVFTQTLARQFVLQGHEVSVVGYSKGIQIETEEVDQGVYVLRLPPAEKSFLPEAIFTRLRLEAAIRRIVRQHQIDLVECPDVRGSLLFGRLGAPLVVRMHGINLVHFTATGRKPPRLSPFFEKRTLYLADHLVAVSRYIRDTTLAMAGLNHRACEVIYNGVDTKFFKPDSNQPRDPNRILFVGRLSETKGAPNLFQALPLVFRRFPDAYLRFVGKDPVDKAGKKASVQLLSHLSAEFKSRVELVGELSHENMPREYRSAAIAVFPSRAEAHPISVLEAMACATPVVFMKHGPGPEMIDDGWDGLLCDTNSPQAIADAIIALLLDQSTARAMGARAAERIASTLSLESAIERNEAFYRRCLETNAP